MPTIEFDVSRETYLKVQEAYKWWKSKGGTESLEAFVGMLIEKGLDEY